MGRIVELMVRVSWDSVYAVAWHRITRRLLRKVTTQSFSDPDVIGMYKWSAMELACMIDQFSSGTQEFEDQLDSLVDWEAEFAGRGFRPLGLEVWLRTVAVNTHVGDAQTRLWISDDQLATPRAHNEPAMLHARRFRDAHRSARHV